MVALLSAVAIGAVYGGSFHLRGRDVALIPMSIVLFSLLVILNGVAMFVAGPINIMVDPAGRPVVALCVETLVSALQLQTLICTALSAVELAKSFGTRNLITCACFGIVFTFLNIHADSIALLALGQH